MGFRLRKSIKVAPGVRVNLSNKSAGVSVGNKFMRRSVSTSGRKTTTVNVPGTPISHVSTSTRNKGKRKQRTAASGQQTSSPLVYRIAGIIALLFGGLGALMGLVSISVGGWVLLIVGVPLLLLGISCMKKAKRLKMERSGVE